jgi:hypothetical protein
MGVWIFLHFVTSTLLLLGRFKLLLGFTFRLSELVSLYCMVLVPSVHV